MEKGLERNRCAGGEQITRELVHLHKPKAVRMGYMDVVGEAGSGTKGGKDFMVEARKFGTESPQVPSGRAG